MWSDHVEVLNCSVAFHQQKLHCVDDIAICNHFVSAMSKEKLNNKTRSCTKKSLWINSERLIQNFLLHELISIVECHVSICSLRIENRLWECNFVRITIGSAIMGHNSEQFCEVVEHLKVSLVPVSTVDHLLEKVLDVSMAHSVLLSIQSAHHIDTGGWWNSFWQANSDVVEFFIK